MAKKQQIGSIRTKFQALKTCKFGVLSLAGIWKSFKKNFHLIMKVNWLKLLQAIKLIIEIVRSILFCQQPQMLLGNWANNKSYTDS